MAIRSHKAIIQSIVKPYGLHVERVKSLHSLYKKNAAFKASTNQGTYLIKPFFRSTLITLTTTAQITRLSTYYRILKRNGYPSMPEWRQTSSGRYWVNRNGRPYYVMEWIEGRNVRPDENDYEKLGKALATLHTISHASRSARSSFSRKHMLLLKRSDRLFRLRLAGLQRRKTEAGHWFRRNGGECAAMADRAWKIIGTPEVKQIIAGEMSHPSFVHGDVTFPNVIINEKGLFLIDWDRLKIDSKYNEIAKTLLNVSRYNPALIQALLRGYQEVKPLKRAERLLVSAFYRLPREAWQVGAGITFGRGNGIFRILERTWEERLKAIRWMDQWAGLDV